MGKQKHKRESQQLFEDIAHSVASNSQRDDHGVSEPSDGHSDVSISDDQLASLGILSPQIPASGKAKLTMMKKFRFQLLHQWIEANVSPCRVADVGGGKGMLAYLLGQNLLPSARAWTTTVIDPVNQTLPTKYKDLKTDKRIRILETESVNRITEIFEPSMAKNFDLLVAMHAHGCNIQIIDAASREGCDVILLPCCVIYEPVLPPAGTHWIQWMSDYAVAKGFSVQPFRLNFKGQNIGLYARHKA